MPGSWLYTTWGLQMGLSTAGVRSGPNDNVGATWEMEAGTWEVEAGICEFVEGSRRCDWDSV